jgi:LacI family transcriptional regulator
MSLALGDQDAQRLSSNNIETVLIEYSHPQMNSILIDDQRGGSLAAAHLVSKGHTSFGFLGDIEPPERFAIHPVKSRLAGFRQGLEDAGLSLPGAHVFSCPYTQKETRQAARELLSLPKPPTAIFAASDMQALSVMKVARELNINIPNDLAVIGFDDIDVADHVDLTTIRQHLDESGRLAVEILLSRIGESDRPLQHINLPLQLIERMTT